MSKCVVAVGEQIGQAMGVASFPILAFVDHLDQRPVRLCGRGLRDIQDVAEVSGGAESAFVVDRDAREPPGGE